MSIKIVKFYLNIHYLNWKTVVSKLRHGQVVFPKNTWRDPSFLQVVIIMLRDKDVKASRIFLESVYVNDMSLCILYLCHNPTGKSPEIWYQELSLAILLVLPPNSKSEKCIIKNDWHFIKTLYFLHKKI